MRIHQRLYASLLAELSFMTETTGKKPMLALISENVDVFEPVGLLLRNATERSNRMHYAVHMFVYNNGGIAARITRHNKQVVQSATEYKGYMVYTTPFRTLKLCRDYLFRIAKDLLIL